MTILQREETHLFAIAVLCGLLIAASNVGHVGTAPVYTAYFYWLVRVLMEAALFVAFREVIEKFAPATLSQLSVTALAILTSHFPFVLAVTTFDIVLGFPELGLDAAGQGTSLRLAEFGLELVYLLDNHVVFCLLLSMPRFLALRNSAFAIGPNGEAGAPAFGAQPGSFLKNLDPPLCGTILRAEAQEHYVRLITSSETRMVLHRFADIIRELPKGTGLRVHRSHWVAFAAISEFYKDGPNLRLRLLTGNTIPVSRSYRKAVEDALADQQPMAMVPDTHPQQS